MRGTLTALELYCGIGGFAAALQDLPAEIRVAGALDVNREALRVYRHNFPGHRAETRNLEGITSADLARHGADLWWLSPPCQPFTHRGRGRDADDPRARSFLHLIERIGEVRPWAIALENVPGFAGSRVHRRLREVLDRAGYRVRETLLCPSELGVPNRRRRYYLTARLDREPAPAAPPPGPHEGATSSVAAAAGSAVGPGPWNGARLPDLVDRTLNVQGADEPELAVDPDLAHRYRHALHLVDPDDPSAVTACFTAAYGRSPVRSGSYLRLAPPEGPHGAPHLRRFAPHEILRLLGFPESHALPPDLSPTRAWPLVGNSLSLPPVRAILASLLD